jgi:hypothetical protein
MYEANSMDHSDRVLFLGLLGASLMLCAALGGCGGEPEPIPDAALDSDSAGAEPTGDGGSDEPATDANTAVTDASSDDSVGEAADAEVDTEQPILDTLPMLVTVTLDGEPVGETLVVQGGNPARWTTDAEGKVIIDVDLLVPGDHFVMASHPEARIVGQSVYYKDPFFDDTAEVVLALTRFDTSDNEDYVFKDPGEPGNSHVIQKCAHCHLTVADSWGDSVHRVMAKNPVTHDVYEGTASGTDTEEACLSRGGTWMEDIHPSTGEARFRCKVTDGVLDQGTTGGCADCHAPGIDGAVGGRDLRDAQGRSYDEGAHCDVCHHVESVDLSGAPGVAGSLKIVRPSEEAPFPGVGEWHPLTFCPNPDNANKLMSCVQRDHFRQSSFCGGCHEHEQAVLVTGASLDAARWPEGKLPIQSTFTEWSQSALAAAVSCQGCHMPSAPPEIVNGADLQAFEGNNTGITGGWPRPAGSVHLHSWPGPRSTGDTKLANPLSLKVEQSVTDGVLSASVTVTNGGAGHAVPTGEPLRAVLLLVTAACDADALSATGGDAVPDFGGAHAMQLKGGDWSTWPEAKVGQSVRVVSRTGAFHDYSGFGPFGDGTFDAAQKGLPIEQVVGESVIESVDAGAVSFQSPLPEGDVAYLVDPDAHAGASGFAFARVTVGVDGTRMVHHYAATDIASDNRLLPGAAWTSEHHFAATCAEPVVTARLIHRALPLRLASERGWALRDQTMVTTTAP